MGRGIEMTTETEYARASRQNIIGNMIQLSELLTALANVGAPNATIDTDEDGQVIIYTNLRYLEDSFCEEMGA
jgi:hypothetical protein